jgi:thioredoxin reductase
MALLLLQQENLSNRWLLRDGQRMNEVLLGDHPIGTRIEADRTGATAVPGVWVAGNLTDPQAQVVSAAAAGLMAGATINFDLVLEQARSRG